MFGRLEPPAFWHPVVLAALCCLLLAAGCRTSRYYFDEPVGSRIFTKVYSGDRYIFELDEDAVSGYCWTAKSDNGDVETMIEHPSGERTGKGGFPGKALVTVRVHRGFSDAATVVLKYRRPSSGTVARTVTLVFHPDFTDDAPWKR